MVPRLLGKGSRCLMLFQRKGKESKPPGGLATHVHPREVRGQCWLSLPGRSAARGGPGRSFVGGEEAEGLEGAAVWR